MIDIMLVDDHPIVLEGFVRLINTVPGLQVVAQAVNGQDAIEILKHTELDIVITDFSMPGISGLKLIEIALLRQPKLKFIMCTMHASVHIKNMALKLGAKGFVTKTSNPQDILEAIRVVANNNIFVGGDIQSIKADEQAVADLAQLESLSTSEFETFKMLAKGFSIKDISQHMNLSEKTINNYQTKVRLKLRLDTPAQLVHFALRNGTIIQTQSAKM